MGTPHILHLIQENKSQIINYSLNKLTKYWTFMDLGYDLDHNKVINFR